MNTPIPDLTATAPDGARQGEEFRNDLRALQPAVGSGNAAARKILSPQELAPLTRLSNWRSLACIGQTLLVLGAAIAFGVYHWFTPWVLLSVVMMGVGLHGLFVLSHEAAHYRAFSSRIANDIAGRLIGMAGGVSMCTYRVTHRLHHNNLYGPQDPDTAIHGGYPRGKAYLWRKLILDLIGWNAWKTYAYFFGSPAINSDTGGKIDPLNDTSPELRAAARQDRAIVIGFHLLAPLVAFGIGGGKGLAIYAVLWMLPLITVLQPILRLRAICEHGGVTDLSSPLTAARSNQTQGGFISALLRAVLFPHHVNFHLEHHLYPAVPCYNLPRLHHMLQEKGALQGAEVRDVTDTLKLVFAPRRMKAV